MYQNKEEQSHFTLILKMQENWEKNAKQLPVIVYFQLENVDKDGFFQFLSPQLVLLVPIFRGNIFTIMFLKCWVTRPMSSF